MTKQIDYGNNPEMERVAGGYQYLRFGDEESGAVMVIDHHPLFQSQVRVGLWSYRGTGDGGPMVRSVMFPEKEFWEWFWAAKPHKQFDEKAE
jgi:hypothetical protein